ncbi:MAG: exonuclease subunit SbcD, partial [Microbacterium sp.]
MRILHTSDWHIGRTFHGHATLDALRGVLEALTAQVRENQVDVVIVAGDVFDSAAPAADCYTLLTDTLGALADTGARVIVTSGNHDSAARLGFQSGLLRDGVHVLTDPRALATPVTVSDAHGPVHFYGIPFLEPALLRHVWPGVRTQEAALTHAMELVRSDLAERTAAEPGRSVAIAHCFAAGVEPTPLLERDIQQ